MGRAAYFARSLLVSDTAIKYGRKYREPSLVFDRIIELALRRKLVLENYWRKDMKLNMNFEILNNIVYA